MTNEIIFSDMEKDVIGEVMNISLGSSATSLSTLLGKRVEITVPKVSAIRANEFSFEGLEPAIGAEISYIEGLDGINLMILKRLDAKAIIEILMGQTIPDEDFQMDEINMSAICEVMNQMMGSAATALADFLGKPINISTPIAYEIESKSEFKGKYFNDEDIIVAVRFNLFIEGIVDSEFANIMTLELSREIVSMFLKGTGMTIEDNQFNSNIENDDDKDDNNINDNIISNYQESVLEEEEGEEEEEEEEDEDEQEYIKKEPVKKQNKILDKKSKQRPKKMEQEIVSIKSVEYESFDEDEDDLSDSQLSNLDLIMSVPLEISVEIGKTRKKIKEILEFGQGMIVELDKPAGALVDIVVNGQMIARGEVVVVNDNFGVRVMEIVKKDEIMKLTF